jgi:tetratricopeptide (TPR) repeat protein
VDTQLLQQQAEALYHQGRIAEAIPLLEQVAKRDPHPSADQLSNLAYLLYLNGQMNPAESYLQQALAIDADHAPSLSNIGLVYQQTGNLEKAEQYLRQAIEADPAAIPQRCSLGALIMKRGAVFDAIDIFQNALQIDESSPDVWSNLAMDCPVVMKR